MDDFLLIPSPYLLPAAGRVYPIPLGGAVGMQVAVSEIVAPPDLETNPYWQNKVGQILLNSRRFISSEFIRKYFDKRFPHWQMPRTWSRENKEWVRLQSILWGEVWKMIEQLYGRSVLAPDIHPAVTFFKVVNECALLPPYCQAVPYEESKKLTGTGMARKIQSENRRLQKVAIECLSDVPFDRETAPVTWQLIEQARRLASINDDFKAQYMKAIGARMTFATFMRADHPKIFSVYDKKIEHRGRKPKGFACKV